MRAGTGGQPPACRAMSSRRAPVTSAGQPTANRCPIRRAHPGPSTPRSPPMACPRPYAGPAPTQAPSHHVASLPPPSESSWRHMGSPLPKPAATNWTTSSNSAPAVLPTSEPVAPTERIRRLSGRPLPGERQGRRGTGRLQRPVRPAGHPRPSAVRNGEGLDHPGRWPRPAQAAPSNPLIGPMPGAGGLALMHALLCLTGDLRGRGGVRVRA